MRHSISRFRWTTWKEEWSNFFFCSKSRDPTIYAHAVRPANFLSMSNWTLRGPNSLPGCPHAGSAGSGGPAGSLRYGREQLKVLTGVEVTTKSVERTAETIGGDIAQREQQQIQRALQLDLPIPVGEPIPVLYVQMDGTAEKPGRRSQAAGPFWLCFCC